MVHFSKTNVSVPGVGEISRYVGLPDCSAFYNWIQQTLEEFMHPGFGPPLPVLTSITPGQQGNLGEAISWLVARTDRFSDPGYVAVLGSALTPFNASALTGLDIAVLYLDPSGVVANDRLFIQEIKTTCAGNLGYASALIADYGKLHDSTAPSLTLAARVSTLKMKLAFEHNYGTALLQRVEDLAQPSAANCTRIRLLPTLVHDRSLCSIATLTTVMTSIQQQGWPTNCLEAWSISMARLNETLLHMANRVPFTP